MQNKYDLFTKENGFNRFIQYISNLDNSLELSDILNNNDELYYNPQIANVLQHTGMNTYNKYMTFYLYVSK